MKTRAMTWGAVCLLAAVVMVAQGCCSTGRGCCGRCGDKAAAVEKQGCPMEKAACADKPAACADKALCAKCGELKGSEACCKACAAACPKGDGQKAAPVGEEAKQ